MPTVAEITQKLASENPEGKVTSSQFADAYNQAAGFAKTDEENQARLQEFMTARANLRKVQPGSAPVQAPIVTPPPQAPKVEQPKVEAPKEQPINPQDEYNKQLTALNAESSLQYDNSIGQLATLQANMDARTAALINNLKATYERRKEDMAKINTAVVANTNTAELRSGRARFASTISQGNIASEERAGIQRIADLDNELTGLILQAQDANDANKLKLLNQTTELIKQKRDEQRQAILDQITIARNAEQDAIKRAEESRAQQTFGRTESEAKAKDIAVNVYEAYNANPDLGFEKIINDYATQEGIDPITLSSAVLAYKTAQQHEDLLNKQANMDIISKQVKILQDTNQAGTINVPGIGEVKIEPSTNGDWAKMDTADGVYLYDQKTGAIKSTGLKPQDLNASTIISALKELGDPNAIVNYLGDNGVSVPGSGSVSFRNNNPLNIKFGNFAQSFGAVQGSPATDGGVFARFPSVEAGTQAAKALLTGNTYANLPLDQAMKKWSGGGYGADVAPAELRNKKISQMNEQEVNTLFESMKQREGWTPGSTTVDKSKVSEFGRVKDDKYQTAAGKLSDDYRSESKDFITQRNAYQNSQEIDVNTTNPQDDISLIFSFMKVVDPTSVVREAEFNTAAKASSLLDQFNIKVGKVTGGQILNSTVRKNIKDTMAARFGVAEKNQAKIVDTYANQAKQYKIDPEDVITDYSSTVKKSVKLQDPKTGQTKTFDGVTQQDIDEALKSGYKLVQ